MSTRNSSIRYVDKLLNDSYTLERFHILLNDYPVFDCGIVQEYIFCQNQPVKGQRKKPAESYS